MPSFLTPELVVIIITAIAAFVTAIASWIKAKATAVEAHAVRKDATEIIEDLKEISTIKVLISTFIKSMISGIFLLLLQKRVL